MITIIYKLNIIKSFLEKVDNNISLMDCFVDNRAVCETGFILQRYNKGIGRQTDRNCKWQRSYFDTQVSNAQAQLNT